ncbi:MAG: ABC transporter ATP-binding protein [Clostridia bacterium]|nr:ABC transporter ATP-binding protein [Clostridia bacterium]
MTATKKTVIEINNLVKQYPSASSPAVNDFSLTCYEGEIVGLLGHNGAGKSTTLKCLTGMLPFTSGSIKINGFDINTAPIKAKSTFGFVSDKHDVFVKMTGIQYVNFMADAYGISKSLRAARLGELEQVFALGDRIFEPISNYSHGMRQKICMIGSLIHRPKLWILDEPMIGLDPLTTAKVSEFMKAYAADGNCILFSSHNINSVRKICERAVIINKGVKTDDFRFDDFALSGADLEEYFLSRTVSTASAERDGKPLDTLGQSLNQSNEHAQANEQLAIAEQESNPINSNEQTTETPNEPEQAAESKSDEE